MGVKLKPLDEQVVVVTGASSGIGLTIATRAAEAGAKVMLFSRNEGALKEIVQDFRNQGYEADYAVGDIGVRQDVKHLAEATIERFGGFDTWINNAGVGIYAHLEEITDEDHERMFRTNYWGVVYGSTEALPQLKRRGGALINIGSIASDIPTPMLSAYAASKHAVKGFTDSLRLELINEKAPVSVTLIKPSGINTPFGRHSKNYMEEASQVPPPVYSPHRVADTVLYAAQHPTREATVGGAGIAMMAAAQMAPGVSDHIFARAFEELAKGGEKRGTEGENLWGPGDDGDMFGGQDGMRRFSAYTVVRTHPRLSLGLGLLASAAAIGWLAARNGSSRAISH
jgi:short-subunit dehydrogenase